MKIWVGLCGFSMAMRNYPLHFPVVEVQKTFYEPPGDAALTKWRAATGPGLEYTMKVWQLVTHAANSPTYRRMKRKLEPGDAPGFFGDTALVDEGWQRSVACAQVLSATGMLFQCPASFRPEPDHIAQLRRFFERIERPAARLLWEPRGKPWLAAHALALSLCQELGLVYVVDPFVTPPLKGEAVYWRLHGIGSAYRSYTDAELQHLQQMLVDAQPPGMAYVMFNNVPSAVDAQRFLRLVAQSPLR